MSALHRFAAPSFAALALACAALPAAADTVGFHLASLHIPARNYNSVNPGMYYRSDAGWTAGAYYNSLRRPTAYGGYTWQYRAFGLTAGLATGYERNVQPLLVPSVVVYTWNSVSARIAYVPRVEKRIGSQVLHLMLEY